MFASWMDQQWITGPPISNWILATGIWNDAGIWDDEAVWND